MSNLTLSFSSSLTNPLFFLGLTIGLFPFVVEIEPENLRVHAPAFFWFFGFLSVLFSFNDVGEDFRKGRLDQLWLVPLEASEIVLRLWGRHLVSFGLPFLITCLLLSGLYGLALSEQIVLLVSLLSGLPSLSFLGVLVAILGIEARGGVLLQGILMFPLALPILLLGVRVAQQGQLAAIPWPCLWGLIGLICVNGFLALTLGSWALRQRLCN